MVNADCPLCHSLKIIRFQDPNFFRCSQCLLIFKDSELRLPPEKEKARYELHTNSHDDANYLKFLQPVVAAVCDHLPIGARGLDYGSGPTPVLTELLKRKGFDLRSYDPFFSPLDLKNIKHLDFVTCTETAEHFFSPAQEFEKIFAMLKSQGLFVLMTELFEEDKELSKWYYAKDPTHVCFYSSQTLEWIARRYLKKPQVVNPRLFIFS